MKDNRGIIWFIIISIFIGTLWLVFKPIFDALSDFISSSVPGATEFEVLLFTALPFVIFGGLAVFTIIRLTKGRREE